MMKSGGGDFVWVIEINILKIYKKIFFYIFLKYLYICAVVLVIYSIT